MTAAPPVRRRAGGMDYSLLVLAVLLTIFGLVMMYSASAIYAEKNFHSPTYFLKRQIVTLVFGFPLMLLFSRVDYHRLREWLWPTLLGTAVALAAALLSPPVGGARRWIRLGALGFQPAEFAKLAMVLYLADYLDRKHSKLETAQGFAAPWVVVGVLLLLIAREPDLGTPALMFGVALLVFYIGGAKLRHIAGMLACSIPVLAFELLKYAYRRQRLLQFLHPFSNARGAGYQLAQSLIAVGSGGWFGKGIGASELKLMYLPAPHTDFIFPIVAEELGWAGSIALLVLFALLLLRGMQAARRAPDLFGTLLGAGLSLMIALQAYFNIAMSIGLLPTKGVPLPFFSFGRSSLLVTLAAVGVLLNISRQAKA